LQKTGPKKRRLYFILSTAIILAGVYVFLLPQLFRLPVVQQQIQQFLSNQIAGSIAYEEEELTIFPIPRIHFRHVRVISGGKISGTIDEISASPHILSILRGKLNISRVSATGINVAVKLPDQQVPLSPEILVPLVRQHLITCMDALASVRHETFRFDFDNTALALIRSGETVLSVHDIGGTLSWQRPVATLSLEMASDLWRRSSLVVDTNVSLRTLSGQWTLDELTPSTVLGELFPDEAGLKVTDATADAVLSWRTDDMEAWRLSADLSDPDISFQKKNSRFDLHGSKASGEVTIDSAGFNIAITELDLDSPGFSLDGEFELDTETPFAGWEIDVREVDLASTREAALFFVGCFETTRIIADVLREGQAPQVIIGQKARTLEGLGRLVSFYLDGHLDQSTLFVPGAELDLTETWGRVTVADGMLYATDVRTRLGNSTGNGLFTLGLDPDEPLNFKVDCDIEADMAQLPPLLERLVDHEAFSREMAGISPVEGTAEGAMVLEKDKDGYQVKVDVSSFDCLATFHRLPFPVALSGDGFLYQDGEIRVEGLRGDIGDSSFSDITAGVFWKSALQLDISSGQARVNAKEFTSWLGETVPALRPVNSATAGTGYVVIDALQFDGPLATPEAWRLQAEGHVAESITIGTPLLSEPLHIHSGRFEATHERIDLLDAGLSFLGARFAATASLADYLTPEPWVLEILSVGQLDQNFCDWIFEQNDIPEAFQWRAPLVALPLTLQWRENEGLRISGQTAGENGLLLAFDISQTTEGLTIHRLAIDNNGKSAAGSLAWDKNTLEISFSGNLPHQTLSTLMKSNQLLDGSIRGDFTARLEMTPPYLKSFTGRVQADQVDFTPAGLPLSVVHLAQSGSGDTMEIESARIKWKDDTISSRGRIERAGRDLVLDVTIDGDNIEWASVQSLMDTIHVEDSIEQSSLLGNIQFACNRLGLTANLTFEPFQAHLTLAKEQIDIVFQNAEAYGISFPGTLTLLPNRALFSFQPSATEQPLEPTITNLREGKVIMDGSFDLSGDLTFEWDRESPLEEAIEGTLSLAAKEGRIYKAELFGKLFSLLNISGMLSGQMPELEKEGFSYKNADFSGRFENGTFELDSGIIDSSAMTIYFEGSEDLVRKEHDLILVVAPLKTVDAVIDKIPLVSDLFERGLVPYPIRVKGGWDDPHLALLSTTAIGGELLNLMGRTLKLPVTILEKLFPSSNVKEAEEEKEQVARPPQ
jgi:hypothetical protein